ncbi:MAG: (d)CMP kinase [Gammaproteobacteria bacterium]
MSKTDPVVTIDGPSGTGKGTVCQLLAKELGWHLLDSGALYRVLAYAAKQHDVDFNNSEALEVLAAHLDVQFKMATNEGGVSIILEGEDITDAIRSEECANNASIIAVIAGVRNALLDRQRAFCEAPGLVTDGRDMGTVVFPHALVKIYLQASREARAHRRCNQLRGKGINVNLAGVLEELDKRDERDSARAIAPLRPAEDAIIVDTTNMSIQQVFEHTLTEIQSRLLKQAG